jgi:hypothetical protein
MNFTMNIHRVKNVRLTQRRFNDVGEVHYATRDIVIETDEGEFALTLFSEYCNDKENTSELLEVKA